MSQFRQELIEFLLTIGKFSAAAVVDPKAVHNAVDNKEAILVGRKT